MSERYRPMSSMSLDDSLSFERLLFLCIASHVSSLDKKAFPPPYAVHVPLRNVLSIPMLPQILEVVVGERNPERVFVQNLEPGKDQLWLGGTAGVLAHFIGEAEGFRYGQQRKDGKERRAFVQVFRQDAAAATR